jgi:hypothetical protein
MIQIRGKYSDDLQIEQKDLENIEKRYGSHVFRVSGFRAQIVYRAGVYSVILLHYLFSARPFLIFSANPRVSAA